MHGDRTCVHFNVGVCAGFLEDSDDVIGARTELSQRHDQRLGYFKRLVSLGQIYLACTNAVRPSIGTGVSLTTFTRGRQ